MPTFPVTDEFAAVHPARRVDSLLELVGNTPLVRLRHVTEDLPKSVEIWAKLEFMNPGGSIKDRTARQIIIDAMKDGVLQPGQTLIDATTGNTGVAYAMLGAALGIEVELVMPEGALEARRNLVTAYGAKVTYCDGDDDCAIEHVQTIVEANPDRYFYANQYSNPSNPKAHELTTGPEIWRQTGGRVTHFIAATGTSGTIMGTSRGLKAQNAQIKVIGCQPSEGSHNLEGLKNMASGLTPGIFNEEELDEMIFVDCDDGIGMATKLANEEGIAAGNSAGANVHAALELAKTLDEGVIVTIICDHADRYLG